MEKNEQVQESEGWVDQEEGLMLGLRRACFIASQATIKPRPSVLRIRLSALLFLVLRVPGAKVATPH